VNAGAGPIAYQWYFKGVNALARALSGQTGTTLSIPAVQLSNSGEYYCVVTYSGVQYSSTHGTLLTAQPLSIATQPHGGTAGVGRTAQLSVAVNGGFAPLHYEWFKDNVAVVPQADLATLTLNSVDLTDGGTYYVVITDSYTGATVSSSAVLVVSEQAVPLLGMGGLVILSVLVGGVALRKTR